MGRHYQRLRAADLATLWARWQRGEAAVEISAALGCGAWAVTWHIRRAGGLPPRPRQRAARHLTLAEREELSRGLAAGERPAAIARRLGRPRSTISRELARNGGGHGYRATAADAAATHRAARPKPSRLATTPRLRRVVEQKLRAAWSPAQIAAWLRQTYPTDPTMHVAHETIYQALYVQARGALRRGLLAHLRRGGARGYRQPRARATRAARRGPGVRGPGQLLDRVSIAERPPSADTRAVPGHWEGDLLIGQRGTQIATLVERQSRFVLLQRLPAADSTTVVDALARRIQRLPAALRQSLTWDQGKELAQHRRLTLATGMQVYFCDPHSPWQRGSNENTNGLLRQYLPKGTDLAAVTQRHLDAIACQLNARPRQTLGWRTPAQVLDAALAAAVASTD